MRPLILAFRDYPEMEEIDFSEIEYDTQLNLNVNKHTRQVAINGPLASTETFTKTNGETSDSDNSRNIMMETQTRTFTRAEESDSDADRIRGNVIMSTVTGTRTLQESSDNDR